MPKIQADEGLLPTEVGFDFSSIDLDACFNAKFEIYTKKEETFKQVLVMTTAGAVGFCVLASGIFIGLKFGRAKLPEGEHVELV